MDLVKIGSVTETLRAGYGHIDRHIAILSSDTPNWIFPLKNQNLFFVRPLGTRTFPVLYNIICNIVKTRKVMAELSS